MKAISSGPGTQQGPTNCSLISLHHTGCLVSASQMCSPGSPGDSDPRERSDQGLGASRGTLFRVGGGYVGEKGISVKINLR